MIIEQYPGREVWHSSKIQYKIWSETCFNISNFEKTNWKIQKQVVHSSTLRDNDKYIRETSIRWTICVFNRMAKHVKQSVERFKYWLKYLRVLYSFSIHFDFWKNWLINVNWREIFSVSFLSIWSSQIWYELNTLVDKISFKWRRPLFWKWKYFSENSKSFNNSIWSFYICMHYCEF